MGKFGLYNKFIVKDGERDTLVDILTAVPKVSQRSNIHNPLHCPKGYHQRWGHQAFQCLEAAEAMENMDECEIYLVNISIDEPNSVFVYEVWRNENARVWTSFGTQQL
jgi:hypothetical protein